MPATFPQLPEDAGPGKAAPADFPQPGQIVKGSQTPRPRGLLLRAALGCRCSDPAEGCWSQSTRGDGEPGREGEKEVVKWKNRKGERKLIEKREWRLEKGRGGGHDRKGNF